MVLILPMTEMRPSTSIEEGRERDIKIFLPPSSPELEARICGAVFLIRFAPSPSSSSFVLLRFSPSNLPKLFSILQKPNPREARALISSHSPSSGGRIGLD